MRCGLGPSRATHSVVDSAHEVRVGVVGQRLVRKMPCAQRNVQTNHSGASGREGRRANPAGLGASERARAGERASGMRLAVHESKVKQKRMVRGRERTSTLRVWRCTLGDAERVVSDSIVVIAHRRGTASAAFIVLMSSASDGAQRAIF